MRSYFLNILLKSGIARDATAISVPARIGTTPAKIHAILPAMLKAMMSANMSMNGALTAILVSIMNAF